MIDTANADVPIRDHLLKLANDLPFLASAKSKPESVVLAEAKARLRAIEETVGQGGDRDHLQQYCSTLRRSAQHGSVPAVPRGGRHRGGDPRSGVPLPSDINPASLFDIGLLQPVILCKVKPAPVEAWSAFEAAIPPAGAGGSIIPSRRLAC